MKKRSALGLFVLAFVMGCRDKSGLLQPEPPGAKDSFDAASAAMEVATDGGGRGQMSSAPDAATAVVDLLHHTAAAIAVSSNVDNPHDFPEHLVDGKRDTAWNGRTGDLVGAWI